MFFHSNRTFFFIPDFVKIQRESFLYLLEQGLIKEIQKRNPITTPTNDFELIFYPNYYQLNPPDCNPKEAILKSKTYACRLYIPAQLINHLTKEVKLQWVLVGNLPLMTKRGHFIINGSPRVIVNQMIRSPGIYYQQKIDKKKKRTYYADLISHRGTWLRLETDKKKRVWARMKKTPKISILIFLQSMGLSKEIIFQSIYYSEFLKNSFLKENHPSSTDQALIELYYKTHPKKEKTEINPEMGQKFLFRKFMNPRMYDLGKLGRIKLNKKLGLSIPLTNFTLTPYDILFATDYLIKLEYGLGEIDDIDHLKNRRVRASGELIQNQLGTGLIRLEKLIREKIKKPKKNLTIRSLITTKSINGALREFFGSSQLSQFMDQTNPLAEITHKRRLSSLGPGGVSRETAGMAVRGIHSSHYGRICPIETPEGPNAGLVNSITTYARMNSEGFIETPFYNVYKGQIQKKSGPVFFSAEHEKNINIAPGDLKTNLLNFLSKNLIPIRNSEEFKRVSRIQVEYIAISPIQMISIATSLIPFLEHDDANRALMGSNMQRQAVPLLLPERPFVGTGLEARIVADSGHNLQSKKSGFVSYVSGQKILVHTFSLSQLKSIKFSENNFIKKNEVKKPKNQETKFNSASLQVFLFYKDSKTKKNYGFDFFPSFFSSFVFAVLFFNKKKTSCFWEPKIQSISKIVLVSQKVREQLEEKKKNKLNELNWKKVKFKTNLCSEFFSKKKNQYRGLFKAKELKQTSKFHFFLGKKINLPDSLLLKKSFNNREDNYYSILKECSLFYFETKQRELIDCLFGNQKDVDANQNKESFIFNTLDFQKLKNNSKQLVLCRENLIQTKKKVNSRILKNWDKSNFKFIKKQISSFFFKKRRKFVFRFKNRKKGLNYKQKIFLNHYWNCLILFSYYLNKNFLKEITKYQSSNHYQNLFASYDMINCLFSDYAFSQKKNQKYQISLFSSSFFEKKEKKEYVPKKENYFQNSKIVLKSEKKPFFFSIKKNNKEWKINRFNTFNWAKKKWNFNSNVYNLQTYYRSNQDTCLNQRPVIREGEWVQQGDLLADGSASVGGELSLGKNILVAYMPWEGFNFEDAILINERLIYDDIYTSIHIERYEIEIRDTKFGVEQITNQIPEIDILEISHLNEKGIAKIGTWVKEGDILVGKITPIQKKPLSPHEKLLYDIFEKKISTRRDTSLRIPKNVEGRVIDIQILETENIPPETAFEGPGRVHIYIAEKRKIQVGDKMAGRHGNKGIVSKILPRQDMPYLPDGTPIDMVLNPLGVPSRMNVGQIFECLLGLAGKYLIQQFKIVPFDEIYGPEASRSLVYSKLFEARLKTNQNWLFDTNFPGKIKLFDGRTGECFHQSVTVGQAYMLKLVHLVDEKIHARSTGPYSLVTQQPLRGRSKHGGQRLGEMEVWALEGFGAAYILQELLTLKSDDMKGRYQVMDAILNNKPISLGTPESFKVLIRELQSLCLDVGVYTVESTGQRKKIDIMKLP